MTPDRARRRVKQVFNDATGSPPHERAAFLDEACGDDDELRQQVEKLLGALDDAPDFLESSPPTDDLELEAEGDDADPDLAGTRISHYSLRRVIAAGGMGTVYEAVQEKPHRTVAVKIMKRGIASKSALRRFEDESQILARLRHPGIAQVYQAGTWGDGGGVPYFVMEYVPNAQPIIDYAREKKLTTAQRLELFADVCDAVHHGHQRGIIHRDLKPANILIDASGRPKIIDFGVARATDSDMAVTTLQTDVGQLIGTLQYMSPEQCLADPHDVDTRSDVYALGVVLYELLCEQLPYDIKGAAVHEAIRVVREEEPTWPRMAGRTVRGDVQTILLKALEKDRDRRYQSAADLAGDITRYLRSEPIVARPPSASYLMRKFAQRHRGLAAGVAAVFTTLVGASIVSTALYLRAEEARVETEIEREEATRQASIAGAINEFLNKDLLSAVSPDEQGREVTMREVLDVASESIDGKFPDEPQVEAAIRATLGDTYTELGLYGDAERHHDAALRLRQSELGDEHPDTMRSMNDLGLTYYYQGRYGEAEPLWSRALNARRRVLGDEHESTLISMGNLAALNRIRGRYGEAERLQAETLDIRRRVSGGEHPETLNAMNTLAAIYQSQGRYDDAEPLALEVLEISRRVLGEDHPRTLGSLNNLAVVYEGQGRYDDSEALHLEALATKRRVLGDEHPDTLSSIYGLAMAYWKQGRFEDAEARHLEALAARRRVLGDEHPETLKSVNSLAVLYVNQGRHDDAERLYAEVLATQRRVLGDEHPDTLVSASNLGVFHLKRERYEEAEPLLRAALEGRRRVLGEQHPHTVDSEFKLGYLYFTLGRFDEAEPLVAAAVTGSRNGHPSLTAQKLRIHGNCLRGMGRHAEAEAALLEARELFTTTAPHEELAALTARDLADLYDVWGRQEQAAEYRALLPVEQDAVSKDH